MLARDVYRTGKSDAQFNTMRTVHVDDPSSAGSTRMNRSLTGLISSWGPTRFRNCRRHQTDPVAVRNGTSCRAQAAPPSSGSHSGRTVEGHPETNAALHRPGRSPASARRCRRGREHKFRVVPSRPIDRRATTSGADRAGVFVRSGCHQRLLPGCRAQGHAEDVAAIGR